MTRSIAAILAGFVFIVALSLATDAFIRSVWPAGIDAAGRAAGIGLLWLSLAYVGVFAIAGSYLTARLAPNRPLRHAMILGALGLLFSVLGTVVSWDFAPVWYHVVALVLVLPYAWVGGTLRERQLQPR